MTIFVKKKTYVRRNNFRTIRRQTILIIGSKNLVKDDIRKSLTMKLTSNKVKAQYLTVTLCENDTYTMEFVSE
jgi:hypothetical protein